MQWFMRAMFPPRCSICGRKGSYVCNAHVLPLAPAETCPYPPVQAVYSAVFYDENAQQIVQRYKYNGCQDLHVYMATQMLRALPDDINPANTCLVPIPLHWTRYLWRGFNQSYLLAKHISSITKIPVVHALKRVKRTAQQTQLNKTEREQNLRDAFVLSTSIPQRRVLLVDDVYTTGATMHAAAIAVQQTGAKRIDSLTFARVATKTKVL